MEKMEEVKQNVRYGISQNDLLEIVKAYEGMPWFADDRFDVEAYEKGRDEILNADKIVQPYEGGTLIGGCLFSVDLKSRIYDIGARIVKLKSPTFNAEAGDSVIDTISTHPLVRYSDAQRKQILAWLGDDFREIAEGKGLKYFNECTLISEKLQETPYESMKETLRKTLDNVISATAFIQDKAHKYAENQKVLF